VRLAAAEDHFLDFFRIEIGHFAEDVPDAVRRQIIGPRHVERAAMRFGERRARACDDDRFSHS